MKKLLLVTFGSLIVCILLIVGLLSLDSSIEPQAQAWIDKANSQSADDEARNWLIGITAPNGNGELAYGKSLIDAWANSDQETIQRLNASRLALPNTPYYWSGGEETITLKAKQSPQSARSFLITELSSNAALLRRYHQFLNLPAAQTLQGVHPVLLQQAWTAVLIGGRLNQISTLDRIIKGEPDKALALYVENLAKLITHYQNVESMRGKVMLLKALRSDLDALISWYRYGFVKARIQLPKFALDDWQEAAISELSWAMKQVESGQLLKQTADHYKAPNWLGRFLMKPNLSINRIYQELATIEQLSEQPSAGFAQYQADENNVGLLEKLRNPASTLLHGKHEPLGQFIRRQHFLAGKFLLTQAYINAISGGNRVERLVNAPFDPLYPDQTPAHYTEQRIYCYASSMIEMGKWCVPTSRPIVSVNPAMGYTP